MKCCSMYIKHAENLTPNMQVVHLLSKPIYGSVVAMY